MHPSRLDFADLLSFCTVVRQKRSGPGGQHRNKVETAVIVTHNDSGVRGEATERRSQQENLKTAIHRLRVNLAIQLRSKTQEDRPSEFWKKRFPTAKLKINPNHPDFAPVLCELLDAFSRCEWDQKRVANFFQCSPSQLIKVLKAETRAFSLVNQARENLGMAKLR